MNTNNPLMFVVYMLVILIVIVVLFRLLGSVL